MKGELYDIHSFLYRRFYRDVYNRFMCGRALR
jgi:hypothetical protein